MSVFDMSIRCGMEKHTVSTTQLSARSFPQLLMETKNGEAHPVTGIPPSLLTTKCTFSPCKLPKASIMISCYWYYKTLNIINITIVTQTELLKINVISYLFEQINMR